MTETKRAEMFRLIETFQTLRQERKTLRLGAMRRFVDAFREQRQLRGGFGFNTFALFSISTDEVSHSAFLAWLLDAEGGHGQGDVFLRAFLDSCQPPIALEIPHRYQVQTEFSGAESRVDVFISRAEQFLLYMENKTVSPAMPDQHDREFRDMRRAGEMLDVPEVAQFAIYLTPRGRRASGEYADRWRQLSYRALGKAFDDLLPSITEEKVRYIVADWLDTLTDFAGAWRKEMIEFSEESRLVVENWRAVMDIIEAKNGLDKELLALLFSLETDLQEQPWWDQGWRFQTLKNEILIHNGRWPLESGKAVLWIGVYSFKASNVFGMGTPPQFYARTRDGHDKLKHRLIERCRAAGHENLEDKWAFIQCDIQKCATEREATLAYPDVARRQMVDLFTKYAQLMMDCEDVVRAYLEEIAQETSQKAS